MEQPAPKIVHACGRTGLEHASGLTRRTLAKGIAAGAALAAAGPARAAATARPPYRDASLPIAARVADLLARMSLEDKAAQLVGVADGKAQLEDAQGGFDPSAATHAFPAGFGHLCSPSFSHVARPGIDPTRTASGCAAYMNAVQAWAAGTRLGIPILGHEEALHGLRARDATSFPQAIALASSWDPALLTRVFAHAAAETRARGSHLVLTPVLDVARDPRWGRVEETYGEDTHLVSTLGVAAIRGFQGTDGEALAPGHVFATVKHFAGHGAPENGTNTGPLMMGERTLREQLLPPYEAAVRRGHAPSVMATYHEVDGVPMAANAWLLQRVLRREWGFEGMVIADYKAIAELVTIHRVAADLDEAAVMAMMAGVDVELPDGLAYRRLPALVRAGRVPMARIDEAVARVLTVKFRAGLFDMAPLDVANADASTGAAAGVALAREAAVRSVVLLKNAGMLPIAADAPGTLAVIGHSAADTPLGGYSDIPRHTVSVLDALRAEPGLRIAYAQGVRLTAKRNWYDDEVVTTPPAEAARLRDEAVALARDAARVLLVLGDNEETAREAWSATHMGDRATTDLFGAQDELARAVLALGKPTTVLLLNGRPPSIPFIAEHADAILEGWYLGQETGHAVADILFGRANPGGKLPISIPRTVGQLPIYYAHKPSARRGYLGESTAPLYAFGHGLSYTRFELSAPRLARSRIARGEDAAVEIDVTNIGARAGDEVVQVYVHQAVASVTRPLRELKAFARVTLAAGERRTVRLVVAADAFALCNVAMQRVIEPGVFRIEAGPGLDSLKAVELTIV